MKTIVLAGATGFVGRALVERLLAGGARLRVLTRSASGLPAEWGARVEPVVWDGRAAGPWTGALEGASAVINLAGENIAAGRWTEARKRAILESRVLSTRALAAALPAGARLVNASAVGFYGDCGDRPVDETRPRGAGFLADVCDAWEREARAAELAGASVALARLGVVLDPGGGALPRMALPFRFFAGGPLGSGRQWMAWIDLEDAAAALAFLADRPDLTGPFNLVSPQPVQNAALSKELGRALGRPSWAPAPAFALKLALGEMADMLLTGQRVAPARLLDAGFRFERPALRDALSAALQSKE